MDQVFIILTNLATDKTFDCILDAAAKGNWPYFLLFTAVLILLWSLVVAPNYGRIRAHWSYWL
jgi:hypothetical protein